jgi:NADPH:quinone reductase
LRTFTAGLELAGVVVAVGEGVTDHLVGLPVMGTTVGAFATYALMDHRLAIPVPSSLSWTDAAALPVALTTEHDALVTQAGFLAGQSVLVVGATSGIGMVAVQMAKALGASLVIGTTTSDSKMVAVRSAGAGLVLNTSTGNLAHAVLEATDGVGVDVVLDHVGGELFEQLPSATRMQGTIVNIGRLAGATTTLNLDTVAFRRIRIQGTTFSVRTTDERAAVAAALTPDVLPAVEDGRIRPIVDTVIPFDHAQDAADRLRANQAVGKLVLELDPNPAHTGT